MRGYERRQKIRDEEMWMWFGRYGISAVSVAVEHCFAGRNAKSKYIEKPIMSEEEKNEETGKSNMEAIAVFEMKKRTNILKVQGLPDSPI